MERTFFDQAKSLHEFRKVVSYYLLMTSIAFIAIFYFQFIHLHNYTPEGDVLFWEFIAVEWILFLPIQRNQKKISDGQTEKSMQVLSEESSKTPIGLVFLIILFNLMFIFNFYQNQTKLIWICRSLSELILIFAIIQFVKIRSNGGVDYRYPYAFLVVETIRQISIYLIVFVIKGPNYDASQTYSGLLIFSIIVFAGIFLLEREQVKYRQFLEFKKQFTGLKYDYSDFSFTGFMVQVPDNLGKTIFNLNLSLGLLVFLFFPFYTYVINNLDNFQGQTIIFVVAFVIYLLILFFVVNARSSVTQLILQYTRIMQNFVESNSMIFEGLKLDDTE